MSGTNKGSATKARRSLKIFVIVLLLLVVFVGLAPTLFSGMIRSKVEEAIRAKVNGEVSVRELSVGWFSGVTASGIEVTATGAPRPSLEIAQLKIDPELVPLLSSDLRGTITASEVAIRARRKDGVIDLSNLMKPSTEKSGELPKMDLAIAVSDVTLSYSDEGQAPVTERLQSIEVDVKSDARSSLRVRGEHGLRLDAGADLIRQKAIVPTKDLTADGSFAAKELDLRAWSALLAPFVSELSGIVTAEESFRFEKGTVSVRGPVSVTGFVVTPAGRSERMAAAELSIEGDLSVNLDGRGQGTALIVGKGLEFSGVPGLAKPVKVTTVSADVALPETSRIQLKTFDLVAPFATVKGTADVLLSDGGQQTTAQFDITGDVAQLVGLLEGMPALAGQLAASLKMDQDPAGALTARVDARVTNFVADQLGAGIAPIREPEISLLGEGLLANDLLTFKDVALKSTFARLAAAGSIATFWKDGVKPGGQVTLNGNGDLAVLCGLMGQKLEHRLAGSLSFDGNLKAEGDAYTFLINGNSPALTATSPALSGGPLALGATQFRANGHLTADGDEMSAEKVTLKSGPINGDLTASIRGFGGARRITKASGKLTLDVDRLGAAAMKEWQPGQIQPGTTDFDVTLDGDTTRIDVMTWNSPQATVSMKGVLTSKDGGPSTGPLELSVKGDLAALAPFLGDKPMVRSSGRADLSGTVGLGDTVSFDMTLRGYDWVMTGDMLGKNPLRVTALSASSRGRYAKATNRTDFSTLSLDSSLMSVKLTGSGYFEKPEGGVMALRVPMEGWVDLAAFPPELLRLPEGTTVRGKTNVTFVGGYEGAPKVESLSLRSTDLMVTQKSGSRLGGTLAATASVNGDRFVARIDGTGLTLMPAGEQRALPVGLTVDLEGTQVKDGPLDLPKVVVKGGGLDLHGRARMGEGVSSDLVLKGTLALDELTKTWLAFFSPDLAASGAGTLDVDISIPAGENGAANSAGHWNVRAGQVTKGGWVLSNVVMDGRIENGLAKVTDGRANLNDGTATVVGQLDMRQVPFVWTGGVTASKVQIRESLQPELAKVIPIFAGVGVSVTGNVDGDMNLSGKGTEFDLIKATLTGNGLLSLSQGRITGGPILGVIAQFVGVPTQFDFEPFDANFRVQDGKIFQDGLSIVTGVMDLKLKGTTGLDGALDYQVGVKVKQGSGKWQQFTRILDKDGFLPFGLGGNIASPAVRPPDVQALLKGALGGALGEVLPGGAGGILNGVLGGGTNPGAGTGAGEQKAPPNAGSILNGILGGPPKDPNKKEETKEPEAKPTPGGILGGILGGLNPPKKDPPKDPIKDPKKN